MTSPRQRVATTTVSVILALVLLTTTGVLLSQRATAQDIAPTQSWQAQINRMVYRAHHWTWTLRRLERRNDQLIVVLAFKNNGNNKRPILLDANYMESSVLTSVDGAGSYELISVEGISAEMSQVDRRSSQQSTFTFKYPQDYGEVRFSSRWLTMFMANGAASVIDVNFDLELPPPQAKPG